jgi:hypothetical protein
MRHVSQSIEQRALASGADFEPTRCLFDLSREDKRILDALVLRTPDLCEAFESVQARIPLPKSATVSIEGHFYRLPNHNRSFCYSLVQGDTFFNGPVLVFKGAEPLLPDFAALLDWMSQAPLRKSTRVMTDHFPLAEGKIPGALSLREALREAEIALEVQRKHLLHYGELARIPIPLLIHSVAQEKQEACAALLRRKLSQPAFDRIEPLLSSGLAVYVYYYPSPPIRSNYWGGGMASAALTQYIRNTFSVEAALSGWVKLMVRLLYLGYLPFSVRNLGLGACMDPGNATLDGGFCDPDSITPIASSPDDEFFCEGIVQSLATLQSTLQLMLDLASSPDLYPGIDEFVCRQCIHALVMDAVASEGRPDLHLDHRFTQLMSPRSIAEIKLSTARRKRIPSYTHFTKQRVSSRI